METPAASACIHPHLSAVGVMTDHEWWRCDSCGATFTIVPKDLAVKVERGRPTPAVSDPPAQ